MKDHLQELTPPAEVPTTSTTPSSITLDNPPDITGTQIPVISQTQDLEESNDEIEDINTTIRSKRCKLDDGTDNDSTTSYNINTEDMSNVSDDYNSHFIEEDDNEIERILSHRWIDSILELHVQYYTGDIEWHPIQLLQCDEPLMVANYITSPEHPLTSKISKKFGRWARTFKRQIHRVVCRLSSVFLNYKSPQLGKQKKPRKKPGVNKHKQDVVKYGIKIPKTYREAVAFDVANGKTYWQTAVCKE